MNRNEVVVQLQIVPQLQQVVPSGVAGVAAAAAAGAAAEAAAAAAAAMFFLRFFVLAMSCVWKEMD